MFTEQPLMKPSKPFEESAVDGVISSIRAALLSGKYNPGDKLPSEAELVDNLGVSRGTIREAMKVLQAYGLVKIKQGNGTFFAEDTEDISTNAFIMRYAMLQPSEYDCWEFRVFFEELIIKNAIKYATEEDIKNLNANFRNMLAYKNNCDVMTKLDIEFHHMLSKITPNKLIRSTYAVAISFLEPTFVRNHSIPNHHEKTFYVHSAIIEAIQNRDCSEETLKKLLDINGAAFVNP